MLKVLDLFSGIGGFSLGLERTGGFQTVAFCEIDPFCRAVLAKPWPEVPCYDDIRELTADALSRDGIAVDLICGGFPCQDISLAGKGAGLAGERSGLWREFARLIGEIRPRLVIVENVSALLGRGISVVLGDLAALGYDAEWHCVPATYVGAPHRRDRVWVLAYPRHQAGPAQPRQQPCERAEAAYQRCSGDVADTERPRSPQSSGSEREERLGSILGGEELADTDGEGRAQQIRAGQALSGAREGELAGQDGGGRDHWLTEPDVGRVAHGVPARVDRLRSLGNAVVPQIPEIIGRAILASLEARP